MSTADPCIRFSTSPHDVRAAHRLFVRRIGACLVEDAGSFRVSATAENPDWIPRLAIAEVDARLAGAQLGGLLPAIGMVSLPYTAVEGRFEGRGVYLAIKRAMLAELCALASVRGLPPPAANISEEAPGSAQYERKVGRGIALPLPFAYAQPAAQGLEETPLVLTFEPLTAPPPRFSAEDYVRLVAAVYRGLYRIVDPERDPTFRRIVAGISAARGAPAGRAQHAATP